MALNVDSAVSVLICRDAGTSGRLLLQRQDLRVRWALTREEVESVIKLTRCSVCVTRSTLAKTVLTCAAAADRPIQTIVLLDPEEWTSWRGYFEAGATAVLRATAVDQLLDALADATGVTFRTAPRVPFKTEVTFALGDEGGSWKSYNISATGIAILEFPPYALGSEVDLAFELMGKRYEFNAVVSQILRVGAKRAVGLEFRELSPELSTTLAEVIDAELQRTPVPKEPVEDFDSGLEQLDQGTVVALRNLEAEYDVRSVLRALTSGGAVSQADARAPWVVAACDALSSGEVAAVLDPRSAPQWAHDAVIARLRVYQIRARAGANAPPDTDVKEVFAHCKKLADSAAGSGDASLVQVTNIRADLLRALYDPGLVETMPER